MSYIRNIFKTFVFIYVLLQSYILSPAYIQHAHAQSDCITDPYMTVDFQVPVEGDYTFWLRSALVDMSPSEIRLFVLGQEGCSQFNLPTSSEFEWTGGLNSTLSRHLTAGSHQLQLSVLEGQLKTSRLLITGDSDCIPTGNGENCTEMDLDIRVDGLQPNQTIEKTLRLTTVLSGADFITPIVEYYFDENTTAHTTTTQAPFCLQKANNACVEENISFLGDGAHTVKVVISASNMETTTRSIPFILLTNTSTSNSTNEPANTQEEVPVTVTPPPSKNSSIIIGNTTNTQPQTVTGNQIVSVAPAKPLNNGDSVTYSINGAPSTTRTISEENSNPSADVDFSNNEGRSIITAEVKRKDGSSEAYNAVANIDNSSGATAKNWFKNGGIKLLTSVISFILLLVGALYLYKTWRQRRNFQTMHNLYDYDFVQPERNIAAYALAPLSVVIFIGGVVFTSAVNASPVQVGVSIDLTRATIPAEYSIVTSEPEKYIKMISTEVPAPDIPTNPETPPSQSSGAFYTKNGFIGRDGKRFVPIGVNGVATARSAAQNPGQWWNDEGMGTMNGRGQLYKDYGFNFVRLNDMRDYESFSFDDYQNGLYDTIDEYTSLGIICMPTFHLLGAGTNPTPSQIASNADYQNYWTGIIDRYKSNLNVWVNPINEPIGTAMEQWEEVAEYQYDLMRSKGWTGIVVIDLPHWAQAIDIGTERMKAFVDGKYNIVIGFHNYDMGNQTAAVVAAQQAGVPIFIAEYGETLSGASHDSQVWVSDNAYELGIGAVAWWGAGNRNDDFVLRQKQGSTWYDTSIPLNDYGQRLFDLAAHPQIQPAL